MSRFKISYNITGSFWSVTKVCMRLCDVFNFKVLKQKRQRTFPQCRQRHSPLFVAYHKVSTFHNSRRVWLRITTFYTDIQVYLFNSHTGYEVISYFRLKLERRNIKNFHRQRLLVEILGSSLFAESKILLRYWLQPAWQTCQVWRHYLLPVGC